MKKILTIMILAVMCLTVFVGCKGDNPVKQSPIQVEPNTQYWEDVIVEDIIVEDIIVEAI